MCMLTQGREVCSRICVCVSVCFVTQREDTRKLDTLKVRTFWQSEDKIQVLALRIAAFSCKVKVEGMGGGGYGPFPCSGSVVQTWPPYVNMSLLWKHRYEKMSLLWMHIQIVCKHFIHAVLASYDKAGRVWGCLFFLTLKKKIFYKGRWRKWGQSN